jgi:hypothetical protein
MAVFYYHPNHSVGVHFLPRRVSVAESLIIQSFLVWQQGCALLELGQRGSYSWQDQDWQLFRTGRLPHNSGSVQDSGSLEVYQKPGSLSAQSQCEWARLILAGHLLLEGHLQFA